jgi:hypothetical protein
MVFVSVSVYQTVVLSCFKSHLINAIYILFKHNYFLYYYNLCIFQVYRQWNKGDIQKLRVHTNASRSSFAWFRYVVLTPLPTFCLVEEAGVSTLLPWVTHLRRTCQYRKVKIMIFLSSLPFLCFWHTLSHNVVSSTSRLSVFEFTKLVVISTDYIGSCNSNYHTIKELVQLCFIKQNDLHRCKYLIVEVDKYYFVK